MKSKTIIAIVFIALGIAILAYSGITFTTPDKSADSIGIKIETTPIQFMAPFLGAAAVVGGVAMILLNRNAAKPGEKS